MKYLKDKETNRMWTMVIRFAVAELRHERLFAIGVALAVCSVLTPTLLLWGVKNGMVTALHDRLMGDPRVREVRPVATVDIPAKWIATMRASPHTAFVAPSVRQISLYGRIREETGKEWVPVDDILPSGVGDPLGDLDAMEWRSGQTPVPCMISEQLAESLGAIEGAHLLVEQTRMVAGKPERNEMPSEVVRLIPRSLSATAAIYLPVAAIERIEDYKDGRGVPEFGWPAVISEPIARFHGCAVLASSAKCQVLAGKLRVLFPQAEIGVLSLDEMNRRLSVPLDTAGEIVFVQFGAPEFDLKSLDILASEIKPASLPLIPYVIPVEVAAGSTDGGINGQVTLRTGSNHWYSVREAKELFLGTLADESREKLMPAQFLIETNGITSELTLLVDRAPDLVVDITPRQAGFVGAALNSSMRYDERSGDVKLSRKNYAGFRMYARTLDDVRDLRLLAEEAGIKVRTQEDRIEQVKRLGFGLSKLFYLIAGMSVVGGFGALFASLYLAVERGKRQFCVLRVLGASYATIGMSILIQAGLLVGIGAAFATVLYIIGAEILQKLFGETMEPGEIFCRLTAQQIGILWLTAIGASIIVGGLASLRLRGLDAAVVARSE